MSDLPKFDKFRVLIITKEGSMRDTLKRAFAMEHFRVDFCSNLQDAFDLVNALRPGILMHDWEAIDKGQNAAFQQRIARIDEYQPMLRVIYSKEITPQLTALAHDTFVRRVLSYTSTTLGLIDEIKMMQNTEDVLGEVQRKVRKLSQSNAGYQQKEVDDLITQAFKSYGHDRNVRLEFGSLCFRKADYDRAYTIADDILRKEPQNVRAMNLLSRIHMKHNRINDAIAVMEKANGLSPCNALRLNDLGQAFQKTGDNVKAKSYFEQALTQDSSLTDARIGLTQIQLEEGDMQAALRILDDSVSEDEAASLFNNAGVVAARNGEWLQCIELYKTALGVLKSKRLRPQVYFNLALAYVAIQEYRKAKKAIESCLKIAPTFEKGLRLRTKIDNMPVAA